MKKALFIVLMLAVAVGLFALITDSAHDFSDGVGIFSDDWNDTGEICKPCHAPHGGTGTDPLWNHTETTETFTLYAGYDMQATPGQPTGASLLCLSCHDGSLALDSFGGVGGTQTTRTLTITESAYVGTDLSNDHPISITYDVTDTELHPVATATAIGGTIATDLLEGGTTVQCSSCHDVHQTVGVVANLLKIDNAGSELCLTCHNK